MCDDKYVYMMYIEIFIVYNAVMPRHELAVTSNTIHCMCKSNVKLHELDMYSQHIIW